MNTMQALYVGAMIGVALTILWQRTDDLDARISRIEFGRIASTIDAAKDSPTPKPAGG